MSYMSPRAYPFFVAPSEARGPSALARLGKTRWEAVAPSTFYVAPSTFLSPRAQARGPSALARLGMTRWEAVAPRRKPRGPSPWGRRPERSVLWDAVPNEVRDASLSFGKTG